VSTAMDFAPVGCGAFRPRAAEERVEVVSNALVNGEYRHLVVACSELAATAAPGQFYQLLCPAPPARHPSSGGR